MDISPTNLQRKLFCEFKILKLNYRNIKFKFFIRVMFFFFVYFQKKKFETFSSSLRTNNKMKEYRQKKVISYKSLNNVLA